MLSIICQKLWARIWVGILSPPFNNFLREDVCGFQVLLHFILQGFSYCSWNVFPFILSFLLCAALYSRAFAMNPDSCHQALGHSSPCPFLTMHSQGVQYRSYQGKKWFLQGKKKKPSIFLCKSTYKWNINKYTVYLWCWHFLMGGRGAIREKMGPKWLLSEVTDHLKKVEKYCLILMCFLCKIRLLHIK